MEVASADLAPIRELYARGLYLQALKHAETFGPLRDWSNTAARLMGGRLAIQLGAPRLGRWLHLRAYRDTPTHHEAIYYHARHRLERFGPLNAWQFLRKNPEWNEAPPEVRADWNAFHGFVAARLRDFDFAERYLNRAETFAHDRAWLCIERASAYEFADRFEDALAAARRSQELQPWFRPGVQAEAHLLQVLGREREAHEKLVEATRHIESGIVVAHLAGIQMDLGHYHDARRTYERYAELSPLMEEEVAKWLAARRCDTAYFTGDSAAARAHAANAEEDFYRDFGKRLESPIEGPPGARLDISLDAPRDNQSPLRPPDPLRPLEWLARFWKRECAPIPEDTIIFDGLPDSREHRWASDNGFHAVEFTVTAETAFALLDRKIPFLFTMVDAGYSHGQIAVGYDRMRQSLWLRELQERRTSEAPLKILLERYQATGPRALVLVPIADARLLDGIVFAEADEYDRLHRLQSALAAHDRAGAEDIYSEMKRAAPAGRLTRMARLALVRYDQNPIGLLQALDGVLELFPNESTFLLAKISALRDLGRRNERFAMACEQLARADGDPLFAQHFAQIVMTDPRQHWEGVRIMRRAIRKRPYAAVAYYFLANLLWELREFHEATDAYRFAAALDDREEQFAEGYFRAARVLEQTSEAMRFLQTRFNRTKGKLAAPARALFYALSEQDDIQMPAAFGVLEQAVEAATANRDGRTAHEVGDILLFHAEMRTNYNEPRKGGELLEAARQDAPRLNWLRVAARIALVNCDLIQARRCWEEVIDREPLAVEAYRNLTRLVADLEGRTAAVCWLREVADRHSTFYPLQQLLIDWLHADNSANDGAVEPFPAEPIIRRLIEQCPDDAWAHRELALHLVNQGRNDEAFAELDIARELEPDNPSNFYTLGHLCTRTDRVPDARTAYEDAIQQSVDNDVAIVELVNLAGEEDRENTLQDIAHEFSQQPMFGDGLLAFRDQAVHVMEPDDLLRTFQGLYEEHTDLWQCWSVTIQQLLMCMRFEEAHELAKEAVIRFPLLARLWLDLAETRRAQNDPDGRIDALRQAVNVAPGWSFAARELAEALEENRQSEEARVVLERAIARAPLDPANHGYLADNLWNANECADAFERLRIGLKLDPGYDWAWRTLGDWAERMEAPERALDVAREVAHLRPGDFRAWLALVRILQGTDNHDETLHALNQAIALNPRSIEAYDLKAERLAEMGRFDEAREAALPEIFEADPPMVLQGRAAWVEARRGRFDVACREMQALVTLEPNYYWGWRQLAEWYNETGRMDEYLEAADKLVDLRPDHPEAIALRGEAKLNTGDREGGKADLREAHKNAPGYSFAGMLLFDAYLQDEEFGNARAVLAVLQEHIGGSGLPFVAARYAQLAALEGDEEAALNALREACSLPCESTWPINTAVAECRKAWSAETDRILSEVILEADEFHPHTLFAWLEGPDGQEADAERKLRHINRAIEVHPRFVQAYDVKAELLARNDRFDEALSACHPAAFAGIPPLILRGRAAWVLAARGDRETAVASMRELLQTDPDYYWGWQQIANWYDAAESHADYLEAAENLVRLGPSEAAAYGYRGEAKLFGGDRRGAKADFHKAFDLDPTYLFAGLHLFDEQLADEDFDGAGRTLARLQEHIGGPYVRLRAARLAARQQDLTLAASQLRELCRDQESTYMLLNKAHDAMLNAGWGGQADDVLAEAVDDEASVPFVGRLWVERAAARNEPAFERKVDELLARGPIGQEALLAAIEALGKPASASRLHECIARNDRALRDSPRGWARTAQALVDIGDWAVAAAWVADWERRDSLEPWMLHPAARAFRMLNRMEEAYAVSRKALTAAIDDAATPDHMVWVALEDALNGRTVEAAGLLSRIEPEDLDDVPRLYFVLAETLVAVQRAGANRKSVFAESRKKAEEALASFGPKQANDDLSRTWRRWTNRIAQDAGGLSAWAWSVWKKLRPSI